MSEALVGYERGEDGLAILTLSDPPANTYSYEMMRSTRPCSRPGWTTGCTWW